MRDVTIDGEVFTVRAMTRGEVKKIRAEGFNLLEPMGKDLDDLMNRMFELVLSTEDVARIDAMAHNRGREVYLAIMAETYGGAEEEKNSGNGSSSS